MSRFELIPLFSGSSGNSTLIRAHNMNILIDAGRNCKQICLALEQVGTSPADIDAVFVTHSHHDHLDGLDVFCRKYPTRIFATEPTHRYISRRCCKKPHPMTEDVIIYPGEQVRLSDEVTVECCSTPHDAPGSVCYKVINGNKALMVMTDLGFVTDDIKKMAYGVDGILIEANYDQRMLVYGPYPEDLKVRIAGKNGHLSNDDCAGMIKEMIDNGTHHFILGHLSENNNTHEKAFQTVFDYLSSFDLVRGTDYTLITAERYSPTKALKV